MTIFNHPSPPGLDPSEDIVMQMVRLAVAPARRVGIVMRLFNLVYWTVVSLVLGWVVVMAIDRSVPVVSGPRVVVNEGGRVHPGEQLLVRSTRRRLRSCELVLRWYIVDGTGRRFDYEPERFDAYGPVTPPDVEPEPETRGWAIPISAAPGEASLTTILSWDCNPLQRALGWSIVAVLPRVKFEVVAPEART